MGNYFWLIIIPFAIGIWAQLKVDSTYKKWAKVSSSKGISGLEAVKAIFKYAGIYDVEIISKKGNLIDHYDPTKKCLVLSEANYTGTSLAALGVAAHEAGHAIQHNQSYLPLKLRSALVPITNFSCTLLPFVIFGGFLFGMFGLIKIGVLIYLILTVFQLVTLPVEFDASRRARDLLLKTGILTHSESVGVEKTLNAAGWTYVAAFIASLGNLIHLIMIARDND